MVGRPSKGPGARSRIAHVRLSPQEVVALAARFGSEGKGLRALVDDWLRMEPARNRRASGGPVAPGRLLVEEGSPSYVVPPALGRQDVRGDMRNPQEVAALTTDLAAALDVPVELLVRDPSTLPGHDIVAQEGEFTEVYQGTDTPVHRHRRGPVIRQDFENGTAVKVYVCSECGTELR